MNIDITIHLKSLSIERLLLDSRHAIMAAITNQGTDIMSLKDDIAALSAAFDTYATAVAASTANVQAAADAAVAADEAGNDVDIKALAAKIAAAQAGLPAAAAVVTAAVAPVVAAPAA